MPKFEKPAKRVKPKARESMLVFSAIEKAFEEWKNAKA